MTLLAHLTWQAKLLLLSGQVALAALYLSYVVCPRAVGLPRLLAGVPLICLHLLWPFIFDPVDEVVLRGLTPFLFTWLASFKVLALALNRGSLCRRRSFVQIAVLYILPITPIDEIQAAPKTGKQPATPMPRVQSTGRLSDPGGTWTQLALRSITKFVGLVFLTHCLVTYEEMPQLVKELMYAVALYCLLGCLMDFPATVAISTTGLAISPHFDQPYASESMASFWGRRWNVATSNTLRSLIYDPIYEGRLVRSSMAANAYSPIRRAVGLCACFIVSGMVHELIYWYLMGFVTGKWQIFFTMQGPAVVLETAVRKWLKARCLPIPKLLSVPFTLSLLLCMGHFFFFPPCTETPLSARVLNNLQTSFQNLAALLSLSA